MQTKRVLITAFAVIFVAVNARAGCWLSRDPIGEHMELDPVEQVARGGPNLYTFCANDPINRVDPLGLWSPEAHDALLQHAFGGQVAQSDIDAMKKGSRNFDRKTAMSKDWSHAHSMARKGESAAAAIKKRDDFINDSLKKAKDAADCGKRDEALDLLSQALHAIMDSSSPMHIDANGNPQVFNPWAPWGHSPNDSIGKETSKDITDAIYKSQDQKISDAYQKVFGK